MNRSGRSMRSPASRCSSLIESLWLARGFTAVLVTHDVQEALALADRVLVIEGGAIALDVAVDLPRPRQQNGRVCGPGTASAAAPARGGRGARAQFSLLA